MKIFLFILPIVLISLHVNSQTMFHRTYDNYKYDEGLDIIQTPDTGYVLLGSTINYENNSTDILLIKTDSLGNVEWRKGIGRGYSDIGQNIIRLDDGYVICGYTNSMSQDWDIMLTKTDLNGDTIWFKNYGQDGWQLGCGVQPTSDGGLMICGTTYSTNNKKGDLWIIRTNEHGDSLWSKTIGTTGDDKAYAFIKKETKLVVDQIKEVDLCLRNAEF